MTPSENPTSSSLRMADAPFDHPAADVEFVTSDSVQFRLFKNILMFSSPFFNDMFSLPRAPDMRVLASDPIRISEDSITFDRLLRLCYPVAVPAFEDLQLLGRVLEAALKYNMEEVARRARAHLDPFRQTVPVEVFVIACRLQLEEEARKAADVWQDDPETRGDGFEAEIAGSAYVPSMARISAGAYFRLIQHGLYDFPKNASFCTPPLVPTTGSPGVKSTDTFAQSFDIDTSKADVVLRSTDETDFVAHRIVLELASAGALFQSIDESKRTIGGLPIALVDIPARILSPLLELCYPLRGNRSYSKDVHLLCDLTVIAMKFEMSRIVDELRSCLVSLGAKHSVVVYFALIKLGWTEEAYATARHASRLDISDTYTPFMEDVSADFYHTLLQYHYRCQRAMKQTIRAHTSSSFPDRLRLMTDDSWREIGASKDLNALTHFLMASIERANEVKNGCPDKSRHKDRNWDYIPQGHLLTAKDYIHDSEELQSKLETALSQVPAPRIDGGTAQQEDAV